MRSKYVGDESVRELPICPKSIKECDPDDLEDEQNKCAVFSYGRSSFHKNDNRYGYIMYEDDLT